MEFFTKEVNSSYPIDVISTDAEFKNIIAYIEHGYMSTFGSYDVDEFRYIRLVYGNSEFDKDLRNILSLFRFVINSFKFGIQSLGDLFIEQSKLDLKYASIVCHNDISCMANRKYFAGDPIYFGDYLSLPTENPAAIYVAKYGFTPTRDRARVWLDLPVANQNLECIYDGISKECVLDASIIDSEINTEPIDFTVKEMLKQVTIEYYKLNKELQDICSSYR